MRQRGGAAWQPPLPAPHCHTSATRTGPNFACNAVASRRAAPGGARPRLSAPAHAPAQTAARRAQGSTGWRPRSCPPRWRVCEGRRSHGPDTRCRLQTGRREGGQGRPGSPLQGPQHATTPCSARHSRARPAPRRFIAPMQLVPQSARSKASGASSAQVYEIALATHAALAARRGPERSPRAPTLARRVRRQIAHALLS